MYKPPTMAGMKDIPTKPPTMAVVTEGSADAPAMAGTTKGEADVPTMAVVIEGEADDPTMGVITEGEANDPTMIYEDTLVRDFSVILGGFIRVDFDFHVSEQRARTILEMVEVTGLVERGHMERLTDVNKFMTFLSADITVEPSSAQDVIDSLSSNPDVRHVFKRDPMRDKGLQKGNARYFQESLEGQQPPQQTCLKMPLEE